MSKGCENHCSMLKQANETIRRMAEWIAEHDTDDDICNEIPDKQCKKYGEVGNCADCIIKYFEGLEN